MAPPDEGGTYAAIDPALMKAMIKDLGDVRDLIRNRVPGLKHDFQKVGLSTKPIDTLVGVAGWVDGETPMLNRRQAMAEQLSKQNNEYGFSGAMVETEWTGLFKTKAEAEAKAKEIAAKYKYGLPDDAWAEIQKYADDPDFAEALARELGPDKVAVLTGLLRSDLATGHNKDQTEARLRALGTAMANASQRGVIDDTWLAQINYKNDAGPSLYDFGALFKYGTWNKDTLVKVGQKALDSDQAGGGNYATAALLDGVARNPMAANELYSKNFDRIQSMVYGTAFQWTNNSDPKLGDPLGRFVYSATAEAHDVYERKQIFGSQPGENPADVLTRRMVLDVDKHKDHPTPFSGVQAAYAGIAKFYYDDIKASVSSPIPSYFNDDDPGRPGVEAPSAAWSTLVQQSMADPKNAADLNLFFAAKYKEESDRIAAGEYPDAKDANSFTNYQNGQLKGWFLQNFEAAKKRAGDKVDAYNKEVDHWVGIFIDAAVAAGTAEAAPAVGVARGAAAGGALVNSTKDFVKTLGVDAAKSYIADIFHKDPPKYDVDLSWAEDTKVWVDKASSLHNAGKIPPVHDPGSDITWTGDPKLYEDLYHGKFTENGQIMPLDKMDANGKLAYQHWLQDPAVQQATWNEFQSDTYGKTHTPN